MQVTKMARRALIIVDVQNDFCPGGSLATKAGNRVAELIGSFQITDSTRYAAQVATQDWHIDPGDHFSDTPDYERSWPRHCVVGTGGADFHPALHTETLDAIFRKGAYSAAYSGFEGEHASGEERDLRQWLTEHDIAELDVVGIATDYCVKDTVLDALKHGFTVRVLLDKCAAVSDQSARSAIAQMEQAGATIIT